MGIDISSSITLEILYVNQHDTCSVFDLLVLISYHFPLVKKGQGQDDTCLSSAAELLSLYLCLHVSFTGFHF